MQPDIVVLVRPDTRPAEEWVCLATRRASHPGWCTIVQQAGVYHELLRDGEWLFRSRTELVDRLRTSPYSGRWKGCLLIPINLSVGLDALEPVLDLPEYVPMFPRRMPTCATATEAMERMRITRGRDKQFARKFAGYRFVPVRIDDAVLVPKEPR